eukprot:1156235-Pelagomonas_calceolata.AAC.16
MSLWMLQSPWKPDVHPRTSFIPKQVLKHAWKKLLLSCHPAASGCLALAYYSITAFQVAVIIDCNAAAMQHAHGSGWYALALHPMPTP